MDSNRRRVTPRPPALPLSYRGNRVRHALSIVVVSVRSVLNITSGCFVLYTWTSKQNRHLASITQSPWVSALVFWISLLTFGGGEVGVACKQQHTPNESDLLRCYSQTDFIIVRRIKVVLSKMSTADV